MRGVYKRGTTYYISFGYKGRRYREPAGTSFYVAQALLTKRKNEVISNYGKKDLSAGRILFSDMADLFLEEHCKVQNTAWESSERFLKQFKSFFGEKYLDEITVDDIERWKKAKVKTCKPGTVDRMLTVLQSLFNKAKRRWKLHTGDNPVSLAGKFNAKDERTRYLSDEERTALLKEANPFLKTIIIFAITTGIRKKGIQTLKWNQVDINNRYLRVQDKGKKPRDIPLNDIALEIINEAKGNKSEYVFPDENGNQYGNWRKSWEGALKRAKITNFQWRDLRHTFASYLAMNGVDLNTIRELMGHSSYKMTLRYAHLSMPHRHKAVETLNSTIAPQAIKDTVSAPEVKVVKGQKQ